MPTHESLVVPYHQQDTDYYCGAACAQMVLDSLGAGLLDQNVLYNDNHSNSTTEAGWYMAPDGLQWTMHNLEPAAPPGPPHYGSYDFVLFALDTEDLISRKIVWTIHNYKAAPIAMVFGSAHWIVVRGYTASAAPTDYSDKTYTIDSFDVNNPDTINTQQFRCLKAPMPRQNHIVGINQNRVGETETFDTVCNLANLPV